MAEDKKLIDKEIVKALKEILEIMLTMGDLQKSATISKSLDLINRQKEDLAKKDKELLEALKYSAIYKTKVIDSEKEINRLQAETDRLKADCENYKQVAENQQKATLDKGFEIKRLKNDLAISRKETKRYQESYKTTKAEAYKEFAEELEKTFEPQYFYGKSSITYRIKNLLKELIGE